MPPEPTADFGAALRQARERRGVSLRQIADTTKISVPALDALERNDISRLPGGIFSRAFVRAYAREVGLDAEQTVRDFIEQFPGEGPLAAERPSKAWARDERPIDRDNQTARAVGRVFGVILCIGIVVAYLAWSGRLASWRGGARRQVQPAEATPISPEPTPTPASEPLAPAALPARDAGVAPAAGGIPEGVLRLALAPRGSCWVSVKADGKPIFSGLMNAGETREVDVRGVIWLTVGDAGVFDFSINGSAARSLGGPGQVVTAVVTVQNYTTFLSHR